MGEPFVLTTEKMAKSNAEKFRKYIESPVLTNIKWEVQGLDVYDVEPVKVPDVFAERPIVIFGKYKGKATGTISVKGTSGDEEYSQKIEVSSAVEKKSNSALKYLWARHKIQMLDHYNQLSRNDERVKEVTQLGLDYNLLTAYTSFVAIDQIMRSDGKMETVKQPLPLPQGVSDYAVGNSGVAIGYSPNKIGSAYSNAFGVKKCEMALAEVADEKVEEPQVIAQAEFSGGEKKMMEFIHQNLIYPKQAKENKVQGKVTLTFTVREDGSITDIKVIKGLGYGCDEEAVRIIKLMPKWKPSNQNGKNVKSICKLAIQFKT